MRRHFFNDEKEGYFKKTDRKGQVKNPISGKRFFYWKGLLKLTNKTSSMSLYLIIVVNLFCCLIQFLYNYTVGNNEMPYIILFIMLYMC